MTSNDFRNSSLFLRNDFKGFGKWQLPIIKAQNIDLSNIEVISINDVRINETLANKKRSVHFFVDDYRFENTYRKPEQMIDRLKQYKMVFTPDFSVYSEMQPWRQLESVAHSRWVGAYWQSMGLTVVPTITWGTSISFSFCFDGVEKGSVVAIGMIGCKSSKFMFMQGYNEMIKIIQPSAIICFGSPFNEMTGNIITVDYLASRRRFK